MSINVKMSRENATVSWNLLGPSESGELTDNGIDEAPLDEIINTWDCEKFRSFLERKFEEYKHVGRGFEQEFEQGFEQGFKQEF